MKGIVFILVIVGLAVLPYVLRRLLRSGMNKAEDAIRNRRIDRERQEGKTGKVESLADRYNTQGSMNSATETLGDIENNDSKFCSFCGKKIPYSAGFCSYCGKDVSET